MNLLYSFFITHEDISEETAQSHYFDFLKDVKAHTTIAPVIVLSEDSIESLRQKFINSINNTFDGVVKMYSDIREREKNKNEDSKNY